MYRVPMQFHYLKCNFYPLIVKLHVLKVSISFVYQTLRLKFQREWLKHSTVKYLPSDLKEIHMTVITVAHWFENRSRNGSSE